MRDLLLGLDVGTTATKAILYDAEGQALASASANYEHGLSYPHAGWVEQDPADLWHAVVEAIRSVAVASRGQGRIVALSLSSQGGTLIPVGAGGRPLRPAISWLDARAASAEGPELGRRWGEDWLYRTTGWWLAGGLPLQHIYWLRHYEPETFVAAERFLFVSDLVLARLTGEHCMDPSNAAITMLYGLEAGDWDERMLEIAGITRRQLSPVRPSGAPVGRLLPAVAAELGLEPEAVVVNGAHDQYCAALGSGVISPGDVLLSCGTAWVMLLCAEHLIFDPQQVFHPGPHVVAGQWGALASLPSAGAAMEWYVQNVLPGPEAAGRASPERYHWLNEGAARAPVGAGSLLFIPLLSGSYSGAQARGAWLGLTLAHTKDEMSRSVMEGVAYEVKRLAERAQGLGARLSSLKMVGGAAASPLWPQVVADVLGLPVILPKAKEAASRGAAILAGVGAGLFRDVQEGAARFQGEELALGPNAENHRQYGELYAIYQDAFAKLQDVFVALGRRAP